MRSKSLSVSLLTLLAVLGSCRIVDAQSPLGREEKSTATDSKEKSEQQALDANLFEVLEQPTTLFSIESPLIDVIHALSEKHNVGIMVDKEWYNKEHPNMDILVSMDASGLRLRDVLDQLLPPEGMSFIMRDAMIQITSLKIARTHQYVRSYNLPPFAIGLEPKVVQSLTKMVSPKLWIQGGGAYSASASDGVLTINANRRVHTATRMTVEKMRRIHGRRKSNQPQLRGDITAPHKDPFAKD